MEKIRLLHFWNPSNFSIPKNSRLFFTQSLFYIQQKKSCKYLGNPKKLDLNNRLFYDLKKIAIYFTLIDQIVYVIVTN